MSGKRGYCNVAGMRRRRKGGRVAQGSNSPCTEKDLDGLVERWLDSLTARNYSPQTVLTRRWATGSFLTWARGQGLRQPHAITKLTLEQYQQWLYHYRQKNGRRLGTTTQRARLGALQAFFSWLVKTNQIPANPASDLELPREQSRPLPKTFTEEEIERIFAVPDLRDLLGIRDRAILEVLYATGIRRRELVALEMRDVDPERATIRVRKGKGGKGRVVPLGACAHSRLKDYLRKARTALALAPEERSIFLTGYGEPFSAGGLTNLVRKLVAQADIGRSGTPHIFRHSCATHMLDHGADIRYIQQMLGHARLETTQIYTHVSIEQLCEVHARCHPSARSSQS